MGYDHGFRIDILVSNTLTGHTALRCQADGRVVSQDHASSTDRCCSWILWKSLRSWTLFLVTNPILIFIWTAYGSKSFSSSGCSDTSFLISSMLIHWLPLRSGFEIVKPVIIDLNNIILRTFGFPNFGGYTCKWYNRCPFLALARPEVIDSELAI